MVRRGSRAGRFWRAAIVGLVAAGAMAVWPTTEATGEPTNFSVVVILTDDQRYDSLAQMPQMNGLPGWRRFTNSFVNEPQCCPSRASTLSGRYSHHTGVDTLTSGANLDENYTIATKLHAGGYQTAFFGKYLNGYPLGRGLYVPPGWDEFQAYVGATDYYNYQVNRNGTLVQHGSTAADYSTDVWTEEAKTFIRDADPSRPFYLEVGYNAPHFASVGDPIPAPRHVGSCASTTFTMPPNFNSHDQLSEPAWLATSPAVSSTSMVRQRRATCETLKAVDEGVMGIIDELAASGRLDNTYVVFTSDNGYAFGEHSLIGKGDLFEVSIRVPLIVRGPGVAPGATPRLTSNVDLLPSVLSLTGIESAVGPTLDGSSWALNALGDASAPMPTAVLLRGCRTSRALANPPCGGYLTNMGKNWGVRTALWKYVEYPSGYKQLFYLYNDPLERRNVAYDPTKAVTIKNMRSKLVALRGF